MTVSMSASAESLDTAEASTNLSCLVAFRVVHLQRPSTVDSGALAGWHYIARSFGVACVPCASCQGARCEQGWTAGVRAQLRGGERWQ